MSYKTIKILDEKTYRSPLNVNMTDNMVRVTLTCSRNEWHTLKQHLKADNDYTTKEMMHLINEMK